MEMYAYSHNRQYPPGLAGTPDCTGALFKLTTTTTPGHACPGTIGPYLAALPENPFTQSSEDLALKVQADGTNASAWYYFRSSTTSMELLANDSVEHLTY